MKSGIIRPVAAFMLALSVPAAVSVLPFAPSSTVEAAGLSPRSWFGNDAPAAIAPVDKAGSKMAAKARREAEKAQQEAKRAQEKADLAASRAHDLAEAEALRAEARAKKAREAAEALKPSSTSNNIQTDASVPASESTTNSTLQTTTTSETTSRSTAKANHKLWKPTGWFKPGDPAAETTQSNTETNSANANQTVNDTQTDSADAASKKSNSSDTLPWNPLTWFGNGKTESTSTRNAADSDSVNAAAVADSKHLRSQEQDNVQAEKAQAAIVETEKGNISIELYPDQAPLTVANFAKLANEGFYGKFNMKFHRVIPGFVVQTGDPTGTGAGGSKKTVPLEVKNKLSHNAKGMVAMARGADPDSATSQFYITLTPQTVLDGKYAVFGKVVGGMDALDKIEKDTMLYGVRIVSPNELTRDALPEKKHFFSSLR
jgi:peptidyl-prolyl cis-trans isomerase B (cyclophilin B)